MKKISAVLLVLVLVGSVVFAGFTGSATTSLGYNFDTGAYGFTNAKAIDIDVVLHEFLGASKGEGAIYAEINASAVLTFDSTTFLSAADNALDITTKISSANIIGDGWKVGILSANSAPNYATSSVSMNGDDEYADLQPSSYVAKVAGINVAMNDYTASLGLIGDAVAGTFSVYGTLTTPTMDLADGLKVNAGGSAKLTDTTKSGSASVKAAYAAEDYTASVAADVIYAGGLEADVAVKAAFSPVTVDAYFATAERYATAGLTGVLNYLSAKVGVALDQVTLTVTGKDLLNAQDLSVSAKLAASKELAVTARGGYVLGTGAWNAGADVVYTAADYTATVNTTYASAGTLALTVKAVSTTLVNKATLTAKYTVADILTGKGALTTEAKIAF
ncbi:MAG: hypothetical protein CVV52_04695 [Spirochaetae bacterium HGW-Spirochaetae-8]|jgi:hypothetical protein|nr:MAG: hypothetical protein CVV52_04695 [Spirochaetae bacterium HGW-Spirochaetae-8]